MRISATRISATKIKVTRSGTFSNPLPGWPERVTVGQVIELPAQVAYDMIAAGFAELVETVRLDKLPEVDAAELERARQELDACERRCGVLKDEKARVDSRLGVLKKDLLADPSQIVQNELETLACERACFSLGVHRDRAKRKLDVCTRRYAELAARSTLEAVEALVYGKLRGELKRTARELMPLLGRIEEMYAECKKQAALSHRAALVERANATVSEIIISELFSEISRAKSARKSTKSKARELVATS